MKRQKRVLFPNKKIWEVKFRMFHKKLPNPPSWWFPCHNAIRTSTSVIISLYKYIKFIKYKYIKIPFAKKLNKPQTLYPTDGERWLWRGSVYPLKSDSRNPRWENTHSPTLLSPPCPAAHKDTHTTLYNVTTGFKRNYNHNVKWAVSVFPNIPPHKTKVSLPLPSGFPQHSSRGEDQ